MSTQDALRLDRLILENFRCFADCEIEFHRELTVLVADNGLGKTAILDAVAIALGLFVDTVAKTNQSHGFNRTDVRLRRVEDRVMSPSLPTKFEAEGSVDGDRIKWSRSLLYYKLRARTTRKEAQNLRDRAERLRKRLKFCEEEKRETTPLLPLVAFYGTGRLWSEHRLTEGKRTLDTSMMGRTSGYIDCLTSSSSFKAFVAWYEDMSTAVRDAVVSGRVLAERPERLLAAVREATRTVLEPTSWHDLDWDFENGQLLVEHPQNGCLPLSFLSDGVRNMIALVADLAHRCVQLNPHFGTEAAKSTPGVLLIDEIDMHLHPRWQQLVVGLLQEAFPKMQMIVSTHSPHVLSTVDVDSIRVIRLKDGHADLWTPRFQTKGVESADVLAAIMNVDPVPQVEEAKWLSEYRAFIEQGQFETRDAMATRGRLMDHFGPDHPVMIDCDRLIRFQSFKLRRNGH